MTKNGLRRQYLKLQLENSEPSGKLLAVASLPQQTALYFFKTSSSTWPLLHPVHEGARAPAGAFSDM